MDKKNIEHVVLDLDSTLIYSQHYEQHEQTSKKLKKTKPCFILESNKNDHKTNTRLSAEINKNDKAYEIYKRPYLDRFIKFLFDNFKTVSIWSVGTDKWVNTIIPIIFQKNYKKLSFILNRNHVWVNKKGYYIKRFNLKIWNKKIGKKFNINKNNSLLIDDNEKHQKYNVNNFILIKEFDPIKNTNDDELLKMESFLTDLKSNVKSNENNYLDKDILPYDDLSNVDRYKVTILK